MAGNVNKSQRAELPRTTSFAGKQPELAGDIPASFRKAPLQRREFDHARDPYFSRQLKDLERTEAQRRGEGERSGRGSQMVKLDKPFPELHPKFEQAPLRETFNRAWVREQRSARLADLDRQREQQQEAEQTEYAPQREREPRKRGWER